MLVIRNSENISADIVRNASSYAVTASRSVSKEEYLSDVAERLAEKDMFLDLDAIEVSDGVWAVKHHDGLSSVLMMDADEWEVEIEDWEAMTDEARRAIVGAQKWNGMFEESFVSFDASSATMVWNEGDTFVFSVDSVEEQKSSSEAFLGAF